MNKSLVILSGVAISALLTGCGSSPSLTLEDQAKLIEYEKCLLLQQDILNTINEKFAREGSELSLIEALSRQSEAKDDTNLVPRFEIHLKNCEKYRP